MRHEIDRTRRRVNHSSTAGLAPTAGVSGNQLRNAVAAEDAAHRALKHFPDGDSGDSRDSVLRAFRAHGTAANLAAYAVRTEAGLASPDLDNARQLWHTLLNLAGPFHDHPEIPEELRETLAEWQAAASSRAENADAPFSTRISSAARP